MDCVILLYNDYVTNVVAATDLSFLHDIDENSIQSYEAGARDQVDANDPEPIVDVEIGVQIVLEYRQVVNAARADRSTAGVKRGQC